MKQRIISSLILLPLVGLAIWFAYPWFQILLGIVIVLLSWEWDKMFTNKLTPFAIISAAVATAAMLMVASGQMALLFAGIVAAVSLFTYAESKKSIYPHPLLRAFGIFYITAFAVSAVFVLNTFGTLFVFWLILIVSATDVGGMMIGLPLRGPALCPSISPKKTWSGFFGGLVFAILIAVLFGILFNLGNIADLILFGAIISVFAVFGDLLESKIKRIVGVKDSSNIIPGHGGMFDRIDSLMFVIIVITVFSTIACGACP